MAVDMSRRYHVKVLLEGDVKELEESLKNRPPIKYKATLGADIDTDAADYKIQMWTNRLTKMTSGKLLNIGQFDLMDRNRITQQVNELQNLIGGFGVKGGPSVKAVELAFSNLSAAISVTDKNMKAHKKSSDDLTKSQKQQEAATQTLNHQVNTYEDQIKRMSARQPAIFNTEEVKKAVEEFRQLATVAKATGNYENLKKNLDNLSESFNHIKTKATEAGGAVSKQNMTWANFGEMIKIAIKKLSAWAIATEILFEVNKQFKQTVKYVTDLNTEMTKILMVTDLTKNQAKELVESYKELGRELGVTTLEVAKGAIEWQRQGKSISETKELLRDSVMLASIANMDQAKSTEYLTSIINGYQLSLDEVKPVLDGLIALDNNYATSVEEIAQAMQRVSNIANQAGVPLKNLAAQITVISSVTRKSAESIGESLKTIYSRMQNVKLGKSLDEEGQRISDVETVLSRLGVKLRDDVTGEFRNMNDVMEETRKIYKKLMDEGQTTRANQLVTVFAGIRQAENLKAFWGNPDIYEEALNVYDENLGIMEEKYKAKAESIEAYNNRISAGWENTKAAFFPEESYLRLLKFTDGLLAFTQAWGKLNTEIDNSNILLRLFSNIGGPILRGIGTGAVTAFQQTPTDEMTQYANSEIGKRKERIERIKRGEEDLLGATSQQYRDEQIAQLEAEIEEIKKTIPTEYQYKDYEDTREMERLKAASGIGDSSKSKPVMPDEWFDLVSKMEALTEVDNKLLKLKADYEETGKMTFDQLTQLQDVLPDSYLQFVKAEGDQLILNTDALKEYMITKAHNTVVTADDNNASEEQLNILIAYENQLRSGVIGAVEEAAKQQKAYDHILQLTINMLKQSKEDEKKALQEELNRYKKIIDNKKKLLDLQLKELQYQNKIEDKNKSISKIQNELLELQVDNSEEAVAKRLELEEELEKQNEELSEMQNEHSIEMQKEALDEELRNFSQAIDDKISEIDNYLNHEGEITQQAIAMIGNMSYNLYQQLIDYNYKYGDGKKETIDLEWKQVRALQAVKNAAYEAAAAISSVDMWSYENAPWDWTGKPETDPYSYENAPWDWTGEPIGYHHDGIKSGKVGRTPNLRQDEVLEILTRDETVLKPSDINNLVSKIPSLAGGRIGSGVSFDNLINLTIHGNVTDKNIADIKTIVNEAVAKLNKSLTDRGYSPNATVYSI